jgi:hypothetical protein
MAQAVDCLSHKHEAQSLNPITAKRRKTYIKWENGSTVAISIL